MAELTKEEYEAIQRLVEFLDERVSTLLHQVPDTIKDLVENDVIGDKADYLNDTVFLEMQAALETAYIFNYRELSPYEREVLFNIHTVLGYPEAEKDYLEREKRIKSS